MDTLTVKKVARLARLDMNETELEAARLKLQNMVTFIEQLGEVNTDNIEPLASVVDIKLRLRDDVVTDGNYQKDVLANAPETTAGFFVVPKVVE